MPKTHAERNAVLARIAVRESFADEQQVQAVAAKLPETAGLDLGEALVQHGVLTSEQRYELEQLVDEEIGLGPQQDQEPAETQDYSGTPDQLQATEDMLPQRLGNWSKIPRREQPTPGGGSGTRPKLEGSGGIDPPYMAGKRYLVEELHDEGGLGRVMRAHDRELNRIVALKEIKPEASGNPASRDRFLVEAEVTGGLEHPCIVPVYSLGSYDDERPYYAMRFIRGSNLGKAIKDFHDPDTASKDPGQRIVELHRLLRRFIDMCHAIQYAHSRGILHRDLKPGNVMLGRFGETLVVDWGLAKVIGRDETTPGEEPTLRPTSGSGSYATLVGSVVGTPAYMSPEQASGEVDQLTAASDIYGLGATLYCLLTGHAPFKSRKGVLEQVRKGEFKPPRERKPDIPRPLEAICLKAMKLDPDDRYASVSELIADLEAWLADEPVSVYQEDRRERLARWMRRNRSRVQSAGIALIAVTVIAVVAAALISNAWRREAESRRQAVDRFVQAREAVDKWMTGVGEVMRHYPGAQKPRQRLLERAAADYEILAHGENQDFQLEIERGRIFLRLGQARYLLGDGLGAERAYREGLALFKQLHERSPENLDCQLELGNSYTNLGVVFMAMGKIDEAHAAYEKSLEWLRPLAKPDDDRTAMRLALATAMLDWAELYAATGRPVEAEPLLRICIELMNMGRYYGSEPQRDAVLIRVRDILGRILIASGRYEEAITEMERALLVAERLVQHEWDNPEYFELKAGAHVYLASALRPLGRWHEEAEAYRSAMADYETLNGAVPNVPAYQDSLALTQMDLGSVLYKIGDVAGAQAHLDQAHDRLAELIARPPAPHQLDHFAYCQGQRARLLRDRGQFEEANRELSKASETYQQLIEFAEQQSLHDIYPEYVQSYALCQNYLALTLVAEDSPDQALVAFDNAISVLSRLEHPTAIHKDKLAQIRFARGVAQFETGNDLAAAQDFADALADWEDVNAVAEPAPEHQYNQAHFLVTCPAEELRDAARAIELLEPLVTANPENADYHHALALALYRDGQLKESLAAFHTAMDNRPAAHAADLFGLALVLWEQGQVEEAEASFDQADDWMQENLPFNPKLRLLRQEALKVK